MAIQRSRIGKRLVLISTGLLATAIAFTSCGEGKSAENTSAPTGAELQRLFNVKCGICHGADGKMMSAGSPDLTLSVKSLDEVIHQIEFGKGTMPAQKEVLSKAEIEALASYVMAFRVKK
jgi:mono/diheme cytochrome c family protein